MHTHNIRSGLVGPILVRVSGFTFEIEKRIYPDLITALRGLGILDLGFRYDVQYVIYGNSRRVWFYDGCGDLIPPSIVKEFVDHIRASHVSFRSRFAKVHVSADHFRRLPVPNIRKPKLGRSWFRNIRTTQEIRVNQEVMDDEARAFRIKIRGKRAKLPTYFDDIWQGRRGDNWKNYRKTQWK